MGQGVVPRAASSAAAMRSCSASGAAAGSPLPPNSRHVARENWYFPRYWPDGETAAGLPEDSHWAILASVALGAVPDPDDGVEAAPVLERELASPSEASVTGPAMPSTARPWLRW